MRLARQVLWIGLGTVFTTTVDLCIHEQGSCNAYPSAAVSLMYAALKPGEIPDRENSILIYRLGGKQSCERITATTQP